ncbi:MULTISPECIES: hypothetical protein [unclassified Luteococcus]|uniref:hypothetical protein n=1 Tax=unclassified Luteococcus TaxID=2639923 RepID=UPI00313BD792
MITIKPWPSVRIASASTTWTVLAYDADDVVMQSRHGITSEDTAAAEAEEMTARPGVVKVSIHEVTTHQLADRA